MFVRGSAQTLIFSGLKLYHGIEDNICFLQLKRKLTSTNVIHGLLSYQELCSIQALGQLPPSDSLEVRYPRLPSVTCRVSEVELCFQSSLPRSGTDGVTQLYTSGSVFFTVSPTACPGDWWLGLGTEMPNVGFSRGCARVRCLSSCLRQLLRSRLLVLFLQVFLNWRVFMQRKYMVESLKRLYRVLS